jgi:hypothetical protein
MDNNNQQNIKVEKNLPSWVFGLSTIILTFIIYVLFAIQFMLSNSFWTWQRFWFLFILIYSFVIILLNIWGIIKGVKALGRTNASKGVLLNIINIVLAIIFGFFAWAFMFARST